MSVDNLIQELFGAGNQVDQLSAVEKRQLIERASVTIKNLRENLSRDGNVIPFTTDITSDLNSLLYRLDEIPDILIGVSLFKCADEIARLNRLLGLNQA